MAPAPTRSPSTWLMWQRCRRTHRSWSTTSLSAACPASTRCNVRTEAFYAAVKLALDRNVVLPANSTAGWRRPRCSVPSMSSWLHRRTAAMGRLVDGSTIQESRTSRYPTTEEVLSALGVVVNKGNLGALQDITDETYQAVAGRESQFADLVPRLAELTAGLNSQVNDIIARHRRPGPILGDSGEQQGQPGAHAGFAAWCAAGAQQEPGQDRRGVRRTQEGRNGCRRTSFRRPRWISPKTQGHLTRRPRRWPTTARTS